MLFLEHYGLTDAGKVRQNNEDSLLVGDGQDTSLFAVADGIGGFEAGEVASSIAVEALGELAPGDSFEATIREANQRILAAAREDEKLSGMGTTVVAIRFSGSETEPVAEVAHVGDSRAYLLRAGELRPLTEDHSLVAELVRSGDLTRAQAAEHPQKNLITRALGAEEEVDVDTAVLPVEPGDRILLCSDGLSDMVPEERIREVLSEPSQNPEAPVRRLLSEALEAGGTDNVTIVLVDVKKREPQKEPRRRQQTRRKRRNLLDEESGGTREMEALSLADITADTEARSRSTREDERRRKPAGAARRAARAKSRRRRGNIYWRAVSGLLRLLAIVLVAAAALTPAYLWGTSQYFLDFEDQELVAYRGVPYEVFGVQLNEEWRRTGIEESDIKGPYLQRIEEQQLYQRDELEEILRDLRS